MSDIRAYCSWCFEKSKHKLMESNTLRRHVYECQACHNMTLKCRYCNEMARGKPSKKTMETMKISGFTKFTQSWDNELCAEHDGTIASFSNLGLKIEDIHNYEDIFKREKYNLAKVGKYTGMGIAGIVSVAGVALTAGVGAAPVAAALGELGLLGAAGTGTAISGLSGAALTSASLAAVGGSVAVGTAIISASGLALGGVMGGVIANKYHGEDKSFAISKLRSGSTDSRTVFINGLTQEKEVNFHDWQCGQFAWDNSHTVYSVNWSSKTNASLGASFAKGMTTKASKKILIDIAKKGGKTAASKLNALGWLAFVSSLAGNPWHSTMFRASQTGIQLAEAISRTNGKKYNLVGHSLGCRVIYYALEALSTKKECFINDVILLGGAVGKDDSEGWNKVMEAIGGELYNCYSKHDKVLSAVYKTANAGLSNPIGINPIEIKNKHLININCEDIVMSHMTWKDNYENILRKIYN